ncbi:MAG: ComF family protein, partial [Clostridia bacterium]|nr:ComF family protein [Clostridia bacterium]
HYRIRGVKKVSRAGVKTTVRACDYYQEAAQLAIRRFKFAGQVRPGKFMGEAVADRVKAAASVDPDVVTFIPSAYGDHVTRGYNTAAKIAEHAGKHLGLPVKPLLKKALLTRTQHSLSASARRQNIENAYAVRGDIRGKRVLLVDDVVTTGSTLAECARVLLEAGAAAVWPIAYAAAGGKPRVDREEDSGYNGTPDHQERTDGHVFRHRD